MSAPIYPDEPAEALLQALAEARLKGTRLEDAGNLVKFDWGWNDQQYGDIVQQLVDEGAITAYLITDRDGEWDAAIPRELTTAGIARARAGE